ncbi:phosphonate C-P lyase system protein PhnH [Roseovarius sp. A21]|uniref:Phosphonate C-P lyase system protein PhnH n=1 Tax=Roseovarius bejariae TaxID=2576383 RepID=A0A844D148_9RHOB|nr:phosphonate C-P lyase system protein PhnH [Roseovarius bejariae]MRU15954.1 phosphonate C-P lyase system protein PhnH [Roseovarius bejariae]
MQTDALQGGFTDAPVQAAQAFRAAMNAMARPGRIEPMDSAQPPAPMSPAAGTLILTLCDPETPVFLGDTHDTPAIRDWITFHTGAPIVSAENAMFAVGEWSSLQPLERFAIGTPEYPDRSATLIVETEGLRPEGARLSGPGIKAVAQLSLPDLAPFQRNAALFPLGLDFFFTSDCQVAALPRSTKVEGF